MNIIDLLNKIANGEEVPKKIKYKDWLYDWNESAKDYECGNDWLEERICDDFKTFLNNEIEIIEDKIEEHKIPEKLNLDTDELRGKETPRAIDYLIEDKINQVIDYLKSKGE